ncbi:MAG: FtsX-like permease family protein, partial [Gemmatimonadetes bacterium]|nr:FtsX-like permease family protein [Gemmatimonadota bacterium]
GSTIQIEGNPVEVVGVSAPGLQLPDRRTDLWMPVQIDPAREAVNWHRFQAVGRLRDGVTPDAAQSDLARLLGQFAEAMPNAYGGGFMEHSHFAVEVEPLRSQVVGDIVRVLWVLLAAVGIVLLIACANVANLFLVRMEARRREVAVRTALGASRGDLALRYLTESVVVALLAGAGALLLAYGGIQLLLALSPEGIPRLSEIALGWKGVAFTALVALGTGVILGLLPSLRRGENFAALRQGARGMTASRGQNTVRGALVIGEIALALVLLAGAGLMLRTVQQLRSVDPGVDPQGVLTLDLSLPAANYRGYEPVSQFYQELSTRVAALPGVTAVGATQQLPLKGGSGCALVFTDDPVAQERNNECFASTIQVTPGYFRALGIPVRGSAPSWSDAERRSGEVVVSRALAERLWPGEDAIGKGIRGNGSEPPFYRIVGVAGDVRANGLDQPPVEQVYFPMLPIEGAPLWSPPHSMTLAVRTATARPEDLTAAIRRLVAEMDPAVPIGSVQTMRQVIAGSTARTSFTMLLLGIAAGVALLLGVIGLYGVVSFVVEQRRGEIGVRMALGASTRQIAGMVVGQSTRLAVAGVVLGVLASLAVTRVLQSLLFETSPTDPLTLAAVSLLLTGVALVAAYLPARRAARVDPMIALRAD